MKGIIVVNSYSDIKGIKYQSERLKSEFALLGVQTEIFTSDRVIYGICGGRTHLECDADFIVYLDKDSYLANIIEKSGIRMFNSARSIELCDDKMLTHIALADNGIDMPETIPSMLCYTNGSRADIPYLEGVAKRLGFPLIAKSSFGSLGKGVYLTENFSELIKIEEELLFKPHLYQKYIPSDGAVDIRLIVIGGKFTAAMKRSNSNDYRSNVECGGRGEAYTPDEKFISIAEKTAGILGLDYCSVDFLSDNGNPLVCEVNSNAFFTEIEACTKIDIAKKYAEHIIKNI